VLKHFDHITRMVRPSAAERHSYAVGITGIVSGLDKTAHLQYSTQIRMTCMQGWTTVMYSFESISTLDAPTGSRLRAAWTSTDEIHDRQREDATSCENKLLGLLLEQHIRDEFRAHERMRKRRSAKLRWRKSSMYCRGFGSEINHHGEASLFHRLGINESLMPYITETRVCIFLVELLDDVW